MTTAIRKTSSVLFSKSFAKAATLFAAMYAVTFTVVSIETGSCHTAAVVGCFAAPLKYAAAELHHLIWKKFE